MIFLKKKAQSFIVRLTLFLVVNPVKTYYKAPEV